MKPVDDINDIALDLLEKGEFESAQTWLRKNARTAPCTTTINNLGAFYYMEGMFMKNGAIRHHTSLALRLLTKAEKYGSARKNYLAQARVYYSLSDYSNACKRYEKAVSMKPTAKAYYNLGVCCYKQGDKSAAENLFQQSVSIADESCDEYPRYLLIHAYQMVKNNRFSECCDINKITTGVILDELGMDAFVIAYLCGEYDIARRIYYTYKGKVILDISTLAMVFDCIIKTDNVQLAKRELDDYCDLLLRDKSYSAMQLRKLNDEKERKLLIAKTDITPEVIDHCYYIGCHMHQDD